MIQFGTEYEGVPSYHFGPVKLDQKKTKEEQFGACDTEQELEQVAKKIGDIRVSSPNSSSKWIVRR